MTARWIRPLFYLKLVSHCQDKAFFTVFSEIKIIHWHSALEKNKMRNRNSEGELVLKKHYELQKIDAKTAKKAFEKDAIPWIKKRGEL